MERKLLLTGDGSHTIFLPVQNITYHSTHGAVQESRHVFIQPGIMPLLYTRPMLTIFEMGFGTGLNALLTLQQAIDNNQRIHYIAAELYPLVAEEYNQLNYCTILNSPNLQPYFSAMHNALWHIDVALHPLFTLHKLNKPPDDIYGDEEFDIIFFDAFAPNDQPELWTEKIFARMFAMLKNNGILLTYSSKGNVRRMLQQAGFAVEKLAGPPGKREITKAIKKVNGL